MKKIEEKTTRAFKKITKVPNLYRREASGLYYLLVKRSGRQFRRSLKTTDFALAKRRLREFEAQASHFARSDSDKGLLFDDLALRWLASIRSSMKPISYCRRETAIKALTPFLRGELVSKIGHRQIKAWKTKRAGSIAAQTTNIEAETLCLMLRYAMDEMRILIENPADAIKRRKVRSVERVIPTREDFRRLVTELCRPQGDWRGSGFR